MSSEKKAMDLQFQVRQNAREYQNSVKDLYSWEKEIKSKELAMQNAPAPKIKTNVSNQNYDRMYIKYQFNFCFRIYPCAVTYRKRMRQSRSQQQALPKVAQLTPQRAPQLRKRIFQ